VLEPSAHIVGERPTSRTPGAPRFDTRIRSLAVPAVRGAPVGVTIAQPGLAIERVGTIAGKRSRGAHRARALGPTQGKRWHVAVGSL
jgi:hypothetical protein